jgi:hypothetical protein
MLKRSRTNQSSRSSSSQSCKLPMLAWSVALTLSACGQHTTAEPKPKPDTGDSKSSTKDNAAKEDSPKQSSAGKSGADEGSTETSVAGARADVAGSSAAGKAANQNAAGESAGRGASAGAGGAGGAPSGEPAVESFRIGELNLRDPHLFVGNTDVTDHSVLGVSVNMDLIPSGLTKDYDNDGFIDVSVVARLDANKHLHLVDARCPPSDPNKCLQHPSPGLDVEWPIEEVQSGACLTLPSSSDYKPAAEVPATPCLLTQGGRDVAMTLGGVPIAMTDTRIALRRDGENLAGLITGFVTLEKAQSALLPSYVPVLAGSPLAKYLRESDRDHAQSPNGDDGFWFYVNFVAEPASYAE